MVDNGATLHVTTSVFFLSYTLCDLGILKIGNVRMSKVIGVDRICLPINMGIQLLPKRVKYYLDVHFNLVSMHLLDNGGYDNHFGSGKWKLTIDNLVWP